jgi:hypothetical protein
LILEVERVHALLTYRNDAPDTVDFMDYLRRLCREKAESLLTLGQVHIEVDAEEEAILGRDLGGAARKGRVVHQIGRQPQPARSFSLSHPRHIYGTSQPCIPPSPRPAVVLGTRFALQAVQQFSFLVLR